MSPGGNTGRTRRLSREVSVSFGMILLIATLASAAVPGPAGAGEVSVQLTALNRGRVPQGLQVRYQAVIKNSSSTTRFLTMSFEVLKVGSVEAGVPFRRWSGSVPAQSELTEKGWIVPSQWFEQKGEFEIVARGDFTMRPARFVVTRSPVRVPRFADVTGITGLNTQLEPAECGRNSAGAAWGDVEGDGDLDLYVPRRGLAAHLWVNEGGYFVDGATEGGVRNDGSIGIGAVFADYDNDGDQDLYVVNDGANRLYRNNGTGTFEDIAAIAEVADDGPGSSASWGDYDSDGYLDLYVTNYGYCKNKNFVGGWPDRLYHNERNGGFSDQTLLLEGTGTTSGLGFQAAWFDFDNDGDQDLYLANDFIGPTPKPNVLWRNDGPNANGSWTFTDVSVASGTGISIFTMGIAIGDYDRDHDFDVALSNIHESVLLRNNGNGTFIDTATYARVARPDQRVFEPSITWGMGFQDLNNDGWEDLYVAAGSLGQEWEPESQPNAMFVNGQDGRFLDLSAPSHADDPDVSRGVAFADYDRDGRVDLYVVNTGGTPRLYRNLTPPQGFHWLQVHTIGTNSNRDGCGARLIAKVSKTIRLTRQVFCGSIGLGSGSDPTVHFGLRLAKRLQRLTIWWPSGLRQVLKNVAVDRRITLTEPSA
jgi:enediyne biosynthesis protein E4